MAKQIVYGEDARKALQYSDRAYVLDLGETVLTGTAQELAGNPYVQSAYLGT